MLYSIINTQKGVNAGFVRSAHILLAGGEKMIVNENELRVVDDDIEKAAKALGGSLITYGEALNIIKKNKTTNL